MLPKCIKNAAQPRTHVQHMLITITPAIAAELLSKCANKSNRTLRTPVITKYANDMLNGQWTDEHIAPIVISKSGVLLDGHHRLKAIIKSGKAVNMWVATDVDDEQYLTMDNGTPRQIRDYVKLYVPHSYDIVAPLAKTHFCLTHGTGELARIINQGRYMRNMSPTRNDIIHDVIENKELLMRYAEWANDAAKKTMNKFRTQYAIAFMLIDMFGNTSQFERFRLDYNMPVSPNPVIETLKQRMLANATSRCDGQSMKVYNIAQILRAYDAYLSHDEDMSPERTKRFMSKASESFMTYDKTITGSLKAAYTAQNRELAKEEA